MFRLAAVLIAGLVAKVNGDTVSFGDSKIVGGTAADISSFPYQVSLQYRSIHFCSGTIYNSRIIITAAHCVRGVPDPLSIKIRYGSSIWSSGGTLVGVSKGLVHPQYNGVNKLNDIALLKTDAPIMWGPNVKRVYLADTEPANNIAAKISGWGSLVSGATTTPSQLRSADVKIISRAVCRSNKYGYGSIIKNPMICAGASGTDSCQGDSGGPLLVAGIQVGIVSFGIGCAKQYYPGVYTSIPVLKSFVTANEMM